MWRGLRGWGGGRLSHQLVVGPHGIITDPRFMPSQNAYNKTLDRTCARSRPRQG